jgi:hypothetical protein
MSRTPTAEKPLLAFIETSKVNDPLFAAPEMQRSLDTRSEDPNETSLGCVASHLMAAIETVEAAGYRVSKPKPKQYRRKGKHKDRVGPTFRAEFADGTVTRMTTFTSLEKLDWDRGERLSIAAYQSRRGTHNAPPAIISAHFEQDGVVLGTRP